MGDRANYAIAGDDGWELFYSHFGAVSLLTDLAAGPERAIAFVREQRPVEHWLDDIWCEGAAAIDPANQVVLLFTWHHDGVTDRKRRLAEIRAAWPGWQIRWAYGGVEDVVAHLGIDRLSVRTERKPIDKLTPVFEEYPQDGLFVLTIRHEDGMLRGYSLFHEFGEPIWAGPALIDMAAGLTPVPGRGVMSEDDTGPDFGSHLDVARREAGFWTAGSFRGSLDDVVRCWPGWRVEFWEDRHEEQTRRCGAGFAMFPFE